MTWQTLVTLGLVFVVTAGFTHRLVDLPRNLLTMYALVVMVWLLDKPLPLDFNVPVEGGAGLTKKVLFPLPDKPPVNLQAKVRYWAAHYRIDPALFTALITQESDWKVRAESRVGARGLGQVMPFNALGCGISKDDLWDPDKNLKCSGKILKDALVYWDRRFPNDADKAIRHALGEYNAGRSAVMNSNALTAFSETRDYVKKIMSNYQPTPRLVSAL